MTTGDNPPEQPGDALPHLPTSPEAFDRAVSVASAMYASGISLCPSGVHPAVWSKAIDYAFQQVDNPRQQSKQKLQAKASGESVTNEEILEPLVYTAIDVLADSMRPNEKTGDRLIAADKVLSRVWGKPKEKIEHEINFRVELMRQVKELEARGFVPNIEARKSVLDDPEHPLHAFISKHPPDLEVVGRKVPTDGEEAE